MVFNLIFGNNDNNDGCGDTCSRSETSCSSREQDDKLSISANDHHGKDKKMLDIQLDNGEDSNGDGGEDTMPSIEAVVSFSPTNSSVNSDDPQDVSEEEVEDEQEEYASDVDFESEEASSSNYRTHHLVLDNDMIEDDIDNLETLLTPRFYNDLLQLQAEESQNKEMEREKRRQLIQNELDLIVSTTQRSLTENDQEIEPECVEALGVAANLVAYRRKYYDVSKCEYVYVPSIARCILDGTLLEAAEPHYFGKFASPVNNGQNETADGSYNDFLVAYAATLGSTVLWSTKLRDLGYLNLMDNELCEDVHLDDDEDDYRSPSPRQQRQVDPVSVWSTPSNENVYINMSNRGVAQYFEFHDNALRNKKTGGRFKSMMKSVLAFLMTIVISSVFGYYYLLSSGDDPQEQILLLKRTVLRSKSTMIRATTDTLSTFTTMVRPPVDDNKVDTTRPRSTERVPRKYRAVVSESGQQKKETWTPTLTLRHSSETHSLTMEPLTSIAYDGGDGVVGDSSVEGFPSTRPIVPNLWYWKHMSFVFVRASVCRLDCIYVPSIVLVFVCQQNIKCSEN